MLKLLPLNVSPGLLSWLPGNHFKSGLLLSTRNLSSEKELKIVIVLSCCNDRKFGLNIFILLK